MSMTLPPKDSWITLKPGATAVLDPASIERWHRKTAALRTARGTILMAAFEVEYALDRIIAEFFFSESTATNSQSSNGNVQHLKGLFDELFLKGPSANFARKISVFKKIAVGYLKSPVVTSDLFTKLEQIKDIRNRFAHYPVTFEPPIQNFSGELIAKLICRDKEVLLDDSFFRAVDDVVQSVVRTLEEIIASLAATT